MIAHSYESNERIKITMKQIIMIKKMAWSSGQTIRIRSDGRMATGITQLVPLRNLIFMLRSKVQSDPNILN